VLRRIAAKLPRISDNILAPLTATERTRFMKLMTKLVDADGRGKPDR
jgi:uncharacterized tellurite resistance protein B-like protein